MGPTTLVGNWRKGEVTAPSEAPSLVARSTGIERELWWLSEESAAAGLWQVRQSETYIDGICHSSVHPSLRWVSASDGRGMVLNHVVWRADPRGGLLLAVQRQPEGMGVSSSTARNAPGGSTDCHGSEARLFSGMWRVGWPLWSLSPHTSPWLCRHWEGLLPEKVCACPSCCLVPFSLDECVPSVWSPPPASPCLCGL